MDREEQGSDGDPGTGDENEVPEPGPYELAFLDARGDTRTLLLQGRKRIQIGRSSSCDVSLRDQHVSRVHAQLEASAGLWLLKDVGSANGTQLNGHRIPRETTFVLRDGDVISVGETRIRFGIGQSLLESSAFEVLEESPEARSYRVDELLKAAPAPDPKVQADFLRAFSGVSRADGLARSLGLVARLLEAQTAAIFVPGGPQGIEAAAAHPDVERASALVEVAHPIMASERARLVRPPRLDISRLESTVSVIGLASAIAVPLHQGKRPMGVLAVQRRHGLPLSRKDLARLAVLGEQLASTLSLQETSENDTRLGVDD